MEIVIENDYLMDIYEGRAVKGKPKYQPEVIKKFIKTVNILKAIPTVETMFQINSLNYEKLCGNKNGYSSVRVTIHYRLEFREVSNDEGLVQKFIITDLSNHYK